MNSALAASMMVIGLLFDLMGTIGLVRLPDVHNRLHATTKCVTLGTCLILLALLVERGFDAMGVKGLLCAIFILLTSPTGAHATSRAAHLAGFPLWEKSVCDEYPKEETSEEAEPTDAQTKTA
jgi:multicomponent Na+:H+ antiporter subunit G